jgi:predicted PurR-regulated permease PerM
LDENLPYYQQRLTEIVQDVAARLNLSVPADYDVSSLRPALGQQALHRLIPLAFDLVGLAAALCLYVFLLLYAFGEVFVMPARLRRVTGGDPGRLELLRRFGDDLRSFFNINAALGAIAAAADTVVLLVLGVDFALLWGLLSFLLSFVPNVGFVVSMIPPALLALLELGPEAAVLVILAYCVINLLVDFALKPRIIGRGVDLSQSVTFLGVIVWGLILGPGGALLSVPLTLTARLVLEVASGSTRYSALIVEKLPAESDGE